MEMLEIHERAAVKAQKLGWKLLKATKLPHPDDHYLIYTIVEMKDNYNPSGKCYGTHLFNGSVNEFAYGHYDISTYEAAIEDLKERVKR